MNKALEEARDELRKLIKGMLAWQSNLENFVGLEYTPKHEEVSEAANELKRAQNSLSKVWKALIGTEIWIDRANSIILFTRIEGHGKPPRTTRWMIRDTIVSILEAVAETIEALLPKLAGNLRKICKSLHDINFPAAF